MISIVACCHGAKLCAHAVRDFRLNKNGAVTRMWRSCRVQPSHKERAIGVVRCKKEGMLLQPLQWCCVDCVIHHEWDVRKEQKYVCVERASNNKRDCDAWSLLLLAATVWSFAHMPLGIFDRINSHLLFLHSRQCEIFAIIIYDRRWGRIDRAWVCKGGMWKKLLRTTGLRQPIFWPKNFKFCLCNLQILTLFWPVNFLHLQLKCAT